MTTIAYDGITLASDSLVTAGNSVICSNKQKIITLDIPYEDDTFLCIGISGNLSDYNKVLSQLCSSSKEKTKVDGIIVGKYRVYEFEDSVKNLIDYSLDTKLAIGSGADYARSAMVLGLTAEEAVAHASKLDIYTGGPCQYWRRKSENTKRKS